MSVHLRMSVLEEVRHRSVAFSELVARLATKRTWGMEAHDIIERHTLLFTASRAVSGKARE
jgi:hypothetical protein